MTPEQYCRWLRGVLDAMRCQAGAGVALSHELQLIHSELLRTLAELDKPRPTPAPVISPNHWW